jgi:hypothetical protein
MDICEAARWLGLVVHGIEGRDEIERLGLGGFVEVAQIGGDERDVAKSFRCRRGS